MRPAVPTFYLEMPIWVNNPATDTPSRTPDPCPLGFKYGREEVSHSDVHSKGYSTPSLQPVLTLRREVRALSLLGV